MFILEADWAIYKRLTGYPLDAEGRPQLGSDRRPVNREVIGPPDLLPYERVWNEGTQSFDPVRPLLPSYGIRLPVTKSPTTPGGGLTSKNPTAVRMRDEFYPNTFRQVPVFDQNLNGRKWADVWPSVYFRWVDQEHDPSTYIFHDPFSGALETSAPVSILNQWGEEIASGYESSYVRPHPESWRATYAIVAQAKTSTELALLCAEVVKLFPARGAIDIMFADGSTHTCDMLYTRTETNDEGRDDIFGTHAADEQRGFARAFFYDLELYFDNTTNQYGVQGSPLEQRTVVNIQERLVQLEDAQTGLINMPETNLNLQELESI